MSNAGMKFDGGKPDLTLLEPLNGALSAVAEVLEFGAKKYARNSWQDVPDGQRRYKAAAMRHSLHALGDLDSESGLLHAAHEACSILFAIQLKLNEKQLVTDLEEGVRIATKEPDTRPWFKWDASTGCPCRPDDIVDVTVSRDDGVKEYFSYKAGDCYWERSSSITHWRYSNGRA